MKRTFLILSLIGFTALPVILFASDSSDAEALRKRCEKEVRSLEVCVANFGDAKDKSSFAEGTTLIKQGKLQLSQSKFKEGIDTYNEYLKLQNAIYTSVAAKYLERTKVVNDAVASEMVDSIDNPKVNDYMKLAYRNYEDAKTAMTRSYPVQTIDACRRSKQYSLGTYGVLKKPVPPQFNIDNLDNDRKIATGK
jgi:hypothetical protein